MNCIACTIPIADGEYCDECQTALDIIAIDKFLIGEPLPKGQKAIPESFEDAVERLVDKMHFNKNKEYRE